MTTTGRSKRFNIPRPATILSLTTPTTLLPRSEQLLCQMAKTINSRAPYSIPSIFPLPLLRPAALQIFTFTFFPSRPIDVQLSFFFKLIQSHRSPSAQPGLEACGTSELQSKYFHFPVHLAWLTLLSQQSHQLWSHTLPLSWTAPALRTQNEYPQACGPASWNVDLCTPRFPRSLVSPPASPGGE